MAPAIKHCKGRRNPGTVGYDGCFYRDGFIKKEIIEAQRIKFSAQGNAQVVAKRIFSVTSFKAEITENKVILNPTRCQLIRGVALTASPDLVLKSIDQKQYDLDLEWGSMGRGIWKTCDTLSYCEQKPRFEYSKFCVPGNPSTPRQTVRIDLSSLANQRGSSSCLTRLLLPCLKIL